MRQILEARAAESSPGLSVVYGRRRLGGVLERKSVRAWPEPAAGPAATLSRQALALTPRSSSTATNTRRRSDRARPDARITAGDRPLDRRRPLAPPRVGGATAHRYEGNGGRAAAALSGRATNEPRCRTDRGTSRRLHRQGAEVIEPAPLQRRHPDAGHSAPRGKGVEPSLADVLFKQSAGNPLFWSRVGT